MSKEVSSLIPPREKPSTWSLMKCWNYEIGKMSSLEQEEASEVMKVLADLSQKANKQIKYLKRDYEILFVFDRYLGAVRFGNSYNGCIASLSEDELTLNSAFPSSTKSQARKSLLTLLL